MSDYYLEFEDWVVKLNDLPGKYLHVNKNKHLHVLKQKHLSTRIWREGDDGSVVWIKNRTKNHSNSLRLNDDELKEFVWIKLSAINV